MLKAGFARRDVTTTDGAVHDPLYAKALALSDGTLTAAVVSVDTICFGGGIGEVPDSFFPTLRESCAALGIDALLCGATHTHTPGKMLTGPDALLERTLDAVREAVSSMEPAKAGFGETHDPSFAVNRTLRLKDGGAWSIRQAHPLPPDREIEALDDWDDTVRVLRIDRACGEPLCTLFTFGCHPLLGYASNAATANFPGVAEALISEQTGAPAMFLQACGGDVTEIAYKDYDSPKCCEGPGLSLGLAALRAWRSIRPADVSLRTAVRQVRFPRRTDIPEFRAALLSERDALVQSLADCPLDFRTFLPLYMKYVISPEYPLAHRYGYLHEERRGVTQLKDQDAINRRIIDKYLGNLEAMERLSKIASTLDTLAWHEAYNRASGSDHIDGELRALRIGDRVLLTLPVEPLSAVGRHLRALPGGKDILIVGYANGYMHYGAAARSYRDGGYETVECFLGEGWEGVMLDAAGELLRELA